jgi:hypothetical protein
MLFSTFAVAHSFFREDKLNIGGRTVVNRISPKIGGENSENWRMKNEQSREATPKPNHHGSR